MTTLLVALEQRFEKRMDGHIYSPKTFDYQFWKRYLNVFEHVFVLARVQQIEQEGQFQYQADGANVSFLEVPMYMGPWEYLRYRSKVNNAIRLALCQADVFILRVPGMIGSVAFKELRKAKKPYGVEVVGDPWDTMAPGGVKTCLRPFLRVHSRIQLSKQCKHADASAYVTEYSLQKRYQPGGWSTHYSSVELPEDAIADSISIANRIQRIKTAVNKQRPWRICYAGTMEQLYKAPDVLIESFAKCLDKGLRAELILLGDGEYRNHLENQAKRLGVQQKVSFLGFLPAGKKIYDQMDRSDLYVLPSRQEGLPRSVIEAMARGLPCIGSTVGGFSELLDSRFPVEPNNSDVLADKITEILSDVSIIEKAIERNVAFVKKYTASVLKERRNAFYLRLKDLSLKIE